MGLEDFFGDRFRYVDVETIPSGDKLEVYSESGDLIFDSIGRGYLDLMWDNSTSLSSMQIRKINLSSEEIFPIDSEGMFAKDGSYIHFNRESYLLPLSELANKKFGTPLKNPRVFQTEISKDKKHVEVYTPKLEPPFYGPDEKIVTDPHLFAPENHLTVCLDALGVPGFKGRRLALQLWKEQCTRDKKSMIPEEYLKENNHFKFKETPIELTSPEEFDSFYKNEIISSYNRKRKNKLPGIDGKNFFNLIQKRFNLEYRLSEGSEPCTNNSKLDSFLERETHYAIERGFPKINGKRTHTHWDYSQNRFAEDLNEGDYFEKKKKQTLKKFTDYACGLFSDWNSSIAPKTFDDQRNLDCSLKGK